MSCKGVGGLGTDSPSTTNHHKRLFIYVMLIIVFGIHLLAQANGEYPQSGVIRDSAGNLYGTALGGVPTPGGVVYKLSPSGDEEVLYTFCSKTPGCADGNVPSGGVVRDPQGNLYGATLEGGKFNRGILYELIPSGDKYDEEVLYDFCSKPGCTDGALPNPGLIRDSLGNLYGTTNAGGTHGIGGLGVIFKFSTSTRLYQSLYNFCSELNCTDGRAPTTGVIRDEKGNLYGTTPNGGNGYGVAYELSATKIIRSSAPSASTRPAWRTRNLASSATCMATFTEPPALDSAAGHMSCPPQKRETSMWQHGPLASGYPPPG